MYLYVVAGSDDGPCKVGVSAHPQSRLTAIQTGNPAQLSLRHVERIGVAAPLVERMVHRALARRKSDAHNEWYEVRPDEAKLVIRAAAAAAPVLTDEQATLFDLRMRFAVNWTVEVENYTDFCREQNEYEPDDLEQMRPPGVLAQFAISVSPPRLRRFNFNSYLNTFADGMWIRYALRRMNLRQPAGLSLIPYFGVYNFLEENYNHDIDIACRWIEWSASRELRTQEIRRLASIWDDFANYSNSFDPYRDDYVGIGKILGISNIIENVRLYGQTGDRSKHDKDCIVFEHKEFRAVLVPNRTIDLAPGDDWSVERLRLPRLDGASLSGFITPVIAYEAHRRPFIPGLREAPERRDDALAQFLNTPAKPTTSAHPQGTFIQVWVDLPCIDEYGSVQDR
jgi:hypothetical protein